MSDMKLIMEGWRRFLHEASNKEFLEEFMVIYNRWHDVQSQYGPIHKGPYTDPDGETHFPEKVQSIPAGEQPEYVRDAPEFYAAHADHPATRRATFSQTQSEIELEKELLRLFQKYADQSFFRNDVLKFHDLSYRSAIQQPWTKGNLNFQEFSREQYLSLEGQRGKDVMSCHGSTDGKLRGTYGVILQGHTVFASRGDLGSQTLRVAHKKIRDRHAGSGVPKRASPHKVQRTEKEIKRNLDWNERLRRLDTKRGIEPREELTRDKAIEDANSVILNSADMRDGGFIEELLIDNWMIEGWYFMGDNFSQADTSPRPENFWKQAWEIGIEKPVYSIDGLGNKRQVDLNDYFGENEEDEISLQSTSDDQYASLHLEHRRHRKVI